MEPNLNLRTDAGAPPVYPRIARAHAYTGETGNPSASARNPSAIPFDELVRLSLEQAKAGAAAYAKWLETAEAGEGAP